MSNSFGDLAGGVEKVQQVAQAADPLIERFKAIAAASAASVLTDRSLTTDDQRVTAAADLTWHNLRSVIGFGVDILRKTDAGRLVKQYVAQVIAADEFSAGLAALSSLGAPDPAAPADTPEMPHAAPPAAGTPETGTPETNKSETGTPDPNATDPNAATGDPNAATGGGYSV